MKRPHQHVSADKGITILKMALPDEWIKRDVTHDYGVDLEVEVVDGEYVTGQRLWLQVKSVSDIAILESVDGRPPAGGRARIGADATAGPCISYPMETRHLKYALLCDLAYLLVVVDLAAERCFWLPIRDEVEMLLSSRNPLWFSQQTARVYIPIENKIQRGDESSTSGLKWYAREPARLRSFWELHRLNRWFDLQCPSVEATYRASRSVDRRALLSEVGCAVTKLDAILEIWEQLQADGMKFVADSTIHNVKVGRDACLELLTCTKNDNACSRECERQRCAYIVAAMRGSLTADLSYDVFRRMYLQSSDRAILNCNGSRKVDQSTGTVQL